MVAFNRIDLTLTWFRWTIHGITVISFNWTYADLNWLYLSSSLAFFFVHICFCLFVSLWSIVVVWFVVGFSSSPNSSEHALTLHSMNLYNYKRNKCTWIHRIYVVIFRPPPNCSVRYLTIFLKRFDIDGNSNDMLCFAYTFTPDTLIASSLDTRAASATVYPQINSLFGSIDAMNSISTWISLLS